MRKERDEEFIRHDCKDRISKLEALLAESSKEKDEMREQILQLVAEVASLRTKYSHTLQLNPTGEYINGGDPPSSSCNNSISFIID